MSDNAVIYARYSSHSQTEQSIEGQIAAARQYAEAKGYNVIREYIDRAKTGRNDNRAEFQRMLSDTAKRQFDIIICWKVDRFGRSREEITFNKYKCKKNGVKVEYVAEQLSNTPESVILESVLEGMAEYYSLQLSQNIHRGQLESAKKCHCLGGPKPLGLRSDPETKRYVIDEKTAPIVRLIFDRAVKGHTIEQIIRELNGMGLKTSKGVPFTQNSIYSVLKNEKYIGVYDYKGIRVEDGIPAIIDRESYTKAQENMKINKRAPAHRWTQAEYILSDKLFCGKCGSPMVGESGWGKCNEKYTYYTCMNRRKKHTCDKSPVRQQWIEGLVIMEVVKLLKDDELMQFIIDGTWEYYQRNDESKQKRDAIQRQLTDTEASIAGLMKALEAGAVSETLITRLNSLEDQKKDLQATIANIGLEGGLKLTRDHIEYFLLQFRKMDYEDPEVQKRLIKTFVNSVFVFDDELTITFNYSGNDSTITLKDLKEKGSEGFGQCLQCSTIANTSEHRIRWLRHVFALTVKIRDGR